MKQIGAGAAWHTIGKGGGNQLTALQGSVRTSLPEDIYQPGVTPNGTYEYDAKKISEKV